MITQFTISNFQRLDHPATQYVTEQVAMSHLGANGPLEANDHFHDLRVAKPDLVGFALLDRPDPYRNPPCLGKLPDTRAWKLSHPKPSPFSALTMGASFSANLPSRPSAFREWFRG